MGRIKRTTEEIANDIKHQSKQCCVCNNRKPFSEFYNYKNKNDGKSYRCKSCDDIARASWREKHPERSQRSLRNNRLKYVYNVDLDWYETQFKLQGGMCAICETTENKVNRGHNKDLNFAVDHNHETGKVRGLLCNQCNRALGMFKDSVDLFKKAVTYLEKNL